MDQLAADFVEVNRKLREAETPEVWEPALDDMRRFLSGVTELLGDSEVATSITPEESARLLSILLTAAAEAGQYRHEQSRVAEGAPARDPVRLQREELLPATREVRGRAVALARDLLVLPMFIPLAESVHHEILPLLTSMDPVEAPDRYMPFRIIQIGNIAERLFSLRVRTEDAFLSGSSDEPGFLRRFYARKYLRFGTSGVRARWQVDLTEARVGHVVQAICDFLHGSRVPAYAGPEITTGKRIVIGYDSRRNATTLAMWAAEVCLANGFPVDFASRATPTPALVYYLTDGLDAEEVAGLINCTPSHNPPEWQGIKFNPRLGYPAPTNVTDYLAARINELQLLDTRAQRISLEEGEKNGRVKWFDPIDNYTKWVLASGKGNKRIPIDAERIRRYFADKLVVVDEMYGAGRGYLAKLLGELGVRHTVIHAETDPDFGNLDYANPEEPFVQDLKDAVKETGATVGFGLDADGDRFGVVDVGGAYFRPNQVIPMLVRYLGLERAMEGRIVATQTGSPLIEAIAGLIDMADEFRPAPGVLPAYVTHPFNKVVIGSPEMRRQENVFLVPVGVKYIEEIRRSDREYRVLTPPPDGWRDVLLIGGEESSGVSVRGHAPDKDGSWGDLLVLDMIAYFGSDKGLHSLDAIWNDTCALPECWRSFGGFEGRGSNSGRSDVDAILEAKEALLDYFLDHAAMSGDDRLHEFAGLEIVYLAGVRYDVVEIQLRSEDDDRHYLRLRSSGTEPISRIYVESGDPDIARSLMEAALAKLEEFCIEEVGRAASEWRLADILAYTAYSDRLWDAVQARVAAQAGWTAPGLRESLERLLPHLERRSQRTAAKWLRALANGA